MSSDLSSWDWLSSSYVEVRLRISSKHLLFLDFLTILYWFWLFKSQFCRFVYHKSVDNDLTCISTICDVTGHLRTCDESFMYNIACVAWRFKHFERERTKRRPRKLAAKPLPGSWRLWRSLSRLTRFVRSRSNCLRTFAPKNFPFTDFLKTLTADRNR